MDSQYVYDGLRGSAFRWSTAGWVGRSGPMCNVDLWIRALDLVDRVSATVKWLRVPSHTVISGKERADVMAEEGRVSSPLYHVLALPGRPVVSLELPSTRLFVAFLEAHVGNHPPEVAAEVQKILYRNRYGV